MRVVLFGAIGLGLIAASVVWLFVRGPYSLKASYMRDVEAIPETSGARVVSTDDLVALPPPVRRYLALAGVVGRPKPSVVRARMHGRIRSGATAPWMKFSAEQHNTLQTKSRLFFLDAAMYGLPVLGYHRYVASEATMDIKLLGLVTVQQASGRQITRTETVTLFNDMCLLSPAWLLDPAIVWTVVDDRTVRATFSNAGHTIQADLSFNAAGELVDFWSDDRLQSAPDGQTKALRWSTPISGYRQFGPYRLAAGGTGQWHEPSGIYNYVELTFDDITYDASGVR